MVENQPNSLENHDDEALLVGAGLIAYLHMQGKHDQSSHGNEEASNLDNSSSISVDIQDKISKAMERKYLSGKGLNKLQIIEAIKKTGAEKITAEIFKAKLDEPRIVFSASYNKTPTGNAFSYTTRFEFYKDGHVDIRASSLYGLFGEWSSEEQASRAYSFVDNLIDKGFTYVSIPSNSRERKYKKYRLSTSVELHLPGQHDQKSHGNEESIEIDTKKYEIKSPKEATWRDDTGLSSRGVAHKTAKLFISPSGKILDIPQEDDMGFLIGHEDFAIDVLGYRYSGKGYKGNENEALAIRDGYVRIHAVMSFDPKVAVSTKSFDKKSLRLMQDTLFDLFGNNDFEVHWYSLENENPMVFRSNELEVANGIKKDITQEDTYILWEGNKFRELHLPGKHDQKSHGNRVDTKSSKGKKEEYLDYIYTYENQVQQIPINKKSNSGVWTSNDYLISPDGKQIFTGKGHEAIAFSLYKQNKDFFDKKFDGELEGVSGYDILTILIQEGFTRVEQVAGRTVIQTRSMDTETLKFLQSLSDDGKFDFDKTVIWGEERDYYSVSIPDIDFLDAKKVRLDEDKVILMSFGVEGEEITIAEFHLQGRHDQKSHGNEQRSETIRSLVEGNNSNFNSLRDRLWQSSGMRRMGYSREDFENFSAMLSNELKKRAKVTVGTSMRNVVSIGREGRIKSSLSGIEKYKGTLGRDDSQKRRKNLDEFLKSQGADSLVYGIIGLDASPYGDTAVILDNGVLNNATVTFGDSIDQVFGKNLLDRNDRDGMDSVLRKSFISGELAFDVLADVYTSKSDYKYMFERYKETGTVDVDNMLNNMAVGANRIPYVEVQIWKDVPKSDVVGILHTATYPDKVFEGEVETRKNVRSLFRNVPIKITGYRKNLYKFDELADMPAPDYANFSQGGSKHIELHLPGQHDQKSHGNEVAKEYIQDEDVSSKWKERIKPKYYKTHKEASLAKGREDFPYFITPDGKILAWGNIGDASHESYVAMQYRDNPEGKVFGEVDETLDEDLVRQATRNGFIRVRKYGNQLAIETEKIDNATLKKLQSLDEKGLFPITRKVYWDGMDYGNIRKLPSDTIGGSKPGVISVEAEYDNFFYGRKIVWDDVVYRYTIEMQNGFADKLAQLGAGVLAFLGGKGSGFYGHRGRDIENKQGGSIARGGFFILGKGAIVESIKSEAEKLPKEYFAEFNYVSVDKITIPNGMGGTFVGTYTPQDQIIRIDPRNPHPQRTFYHEMGHQVHWLLKRTSGGRKLDKEWSKLCRNEYAKFAFISPYDSMCEEPSETFAEIFRIFYFDHKGDKNSFRKFLKEKNNYGSDNIVYEKPFMEILKNVIETNKIKG